MKKILRSTPATSVPAGAKFSGAARPVRPRIADATGRLLTLQEGPPTYTCLHAAPDGTCTHVILGVGPLGLPHPFSAQSLPHPDLSDSALQVRWLECPQFIAAMEALDPAWRQRIPSHWQPLSAQDLDTLPAECHVWWNRQNMRLFPSFWGEVLGAVQAHYVCPSRHVPAERSVILPGNEGQLLHAELVQAFTEAGYAVGTPEAQPASLRQFLAREQPSLFFSVNLRGLDAEGAAFALLRAMGVPVALWFVDNPWHILSALRQPWWKEAALFVTDASFIPALRAAGAKQVTHLPLAVAPHMWRSGEDELCPDTPEVVAARSAACIFVGRASFPSRNKFFAAARISEAARSASLRLLNNEETLPHFHWWAARMRIPLWPGHAVRSAGLGAESCSTWRRAGWLTEAMPEGLAVFGDTEGWGRLLPSPPPSMLLPSLDYYTQLAAVYAAAPCTLNVTSLLLPAGLTQRHFDVWAAGGFLLSDATPGMEIFPENLVRPMRVGCMQDLPSAIRRVRESIALRQDLSAQWREHLRMEHCYAHRVARVLETVGLA